MKLFPAQVNLMMLAVAMLCSCSSPPVPPTLSKTTPPHASSRQWQGRSFDKVVGYRFADSAEWRSVIRLDLHQLDMAYLQKMKRNEAVLTEEQTDELMDAIFSKHPPSFVAICYEPHHIFVFFSKAQPVGAFEFCLQCHQYRAWPKRDLAVNESYVKLASLCRKLRLGVKPPAR